MLAEVVDSEKIDHFSIGDMVREVDEELKNETTKKELVSFLEKNYRGWSSLEEIMDILQGRSTTKHLPTDVVLTLIKR